MRDLLRLACASFWIETNGGYDGTALRAGRDRGHGRIGQSLSRQQHRRPVNLSGTKSSLDASTQRERRDEDPKRFSREAKRDARERPSRPARAGDEAERSSETRERTAQRIGPRRGCRDESGIELRRRSEGWLPSFGATVSAMHTVKLVEQRSGSTMTQRKEGRGTSDRCSDGYAPSVTRSDHQRSIRAPKGDPSRAACERTARVDLRTESGASH